MTEEKSKKTISKTFYLWAYPKTNSLKDVGVIEGGLFRYELSLNGQTIYESGQILINSKTVTFDIPNDEEKLIASALETLRGDKEKAKDVLTATLNLIERIENSLKQITFDGEAEILPKDDGIDDDTPF